MLVGKKQFAALLVSTLGLIAVSVLNASHKTIGQTTILLQQKGTRKKDTLSH
jgi:hypothetical protein